MKNLSLFILFITLVTVSPFNAAAQLIQQYTFTGSLGNEVSLPPNGQPPNGSLGNIRRGSGITPGSASNAFSALGFTLSTTVDTSDYFEFSVKANLGFKLNLDSVVFSERRSSSGIRNFVVRSSQDNFITDLSTFDVPDDSEFRNNQKTTLGPLFKNIEASSTIRFRMYGYAAESATGTWRLDSIRVYGNILASVGPTNPKASFSAIAQTVAENADSIRITVKISPTPTSPYNVRVLVKSGTAIVGTDYTPASGNTITFPANVSSSIFKVKLLDDLVLDGNKNLVFALSEGISGIIPSPEIGPDSIHTVTITDNESIVVVGGIPFTRTIGSIRGANTGNQADSVGRNVRLFGTVYGVNQRLSSGVPPVAQTGYQMYLRDATGGIGIFKTTYVSGVNTLTEGDSIRIMGKIEVFRGLSQINPDSIVVIATGRNIKTPSVAAKVNEALEADLVRLNGVQLVDASKWTTGLGNTGFSVKVFNGTDTVDVRIDNDCPLYSEAAPIGTFDLIGMGSQFAGNTAPFVGGYQLIPRRVSDLIPITSLNPLCNCELEVKLYPNPGKHEITLENKSNGKLGFKVFNSIGKLMLEISKASEFEKIKTSDWASGIYTIRITETGKTIRWLKN